MSNNSSPSTPSYGGDEYNRRLAGIQLEEDSPFRYAPMVSFKYNYYYLDSI